MDAAIKLIKGSPLWFETVAWAARRGFDDRSMSLIESWKETPYMVDARTHGPDTVEWYQMMEWCYDKWGRQCSVIHSIEGDWHCGGATIQGWTWMGFKTQYMLDEFKAKWETR